MKKLRGEIGELRERMVGLLEGLRPTFRGVTGKATP